VNCPVCGRSVSIEWARARDVEYQSVHESFEYRRCVDCNSVYLVDPPVDRLGVIYPAGYYSFAGDSGGGLAQTVKSALDQRWFARALRAVKGAELSVLDIGGGVGHQLETVRRADRRVRRTTIVDLDANAASRARSAGHEFVQATIESADVKGSFDVILMLNIIEHVADPLAVLQRVHKLLAPGGVALVKTPNVDSWDARLFRDRNWGGLHCPRHFVLFNAVSFMVLATKAKLLPSLPKYTQGAPFWAVSVLASLEQRGWVSISPERPMWRHPLYGPLSVGFAAFDFARQPFARLSQMTFTLRHPPALPTPPVT
jgi:2-polyprenyl-3-methyl-5-hydroxy-6-metoxy-1,4-benzoquinol methylase